MREKLAKIGVQTVNVVFLSLMSCIMVATILIDKNMDSLFPNTVKYANGGYYLFALAALVLVLRLLYKYRSTDIGVIAFYIGLSIMFIVVAALEWSISGFMYETGRYSPGGDFEQVRLAATALAQGGTFADFEYFTVNANNANIAMLLSVIYRIIPSWRVIAFLNALCTNVAAMLMALSVLRVCKCRKIALLTGGGVFCCH